MFLAIINDTYSEVKEELSSQKDELQITDIIKQVKLEFSVLFAIWGHYNIRILQIKLQIISNKTHFCIKSYSRTFMKLKLKKEKISDVQKALRSGSGEIEFQDFRETLKEWVIKKQNKTQVNPEV